MEETWIFGPEQFTHELYENGGKPGKTAKSINETQDDDDDEDSDDEHSDDEDSDDEGSDDSSDDTTDDATDDTTPSTDDSSDDSDDATPGSGGSGSCVVSDMVIGNWTSHNNNYTFTVEGVSEVKTITFTDSNNRFYIERTTTVNGVAVTRRYVYQKQ